MESILKLVDNYSISFVISALVIYTLVQVVNILLDKLKYSSFAVNKKHDALLEVRKTVTIPLVEHMRKAMFKAGANRAFIYEYHNGVVSLGGLPFMKMSLSFETVDNTFPIQHMRENISFNPFQSMMVLLDEHGYIIIDQNNKNPAISPMVYSMMGENDIDICVCTKIVNSKGHTIGMVGLDYVRGNTEFNIHRHSVEGVVKELALEAGALLSIK